MNNINEREIETSISLMNTQKYVLAKLIASGDERQQAYEAVSRGRNIVAARDGLASKNLMQFNDDRKEASITDIGVEVMKKEGLVDDMGQLTEQGNQFAYAESPEDIEEIGAQNAPAEMPQNATPDMKPSTPMGDGQGTAAMNALGVGTGEAPAESWSMISDMNDILNEKEFLKKTNKS